MEKDRIGSDSQAAIAPLMEEQDVKAIDDSHLSPNALKVAATECLNSWMHYLQVLNTMCAAGFRLSQSLTNLSQAQNISMASNCQSSWEELTRATIIASNNVKSHVAAVMQDMNIGETFTETDAQRQQDHNQQIISENILTFINLQYQFSIAGCECFGSMAMCPLCQTSPGGPHEPDCTMASLQQCFNRVNIQESRSQMSSPHCPQEHNLESPKSHERQASPHNIETRGSSPFQDVVRGSSPIQGFSDNLRPAPPLETIRGPFPNPGQLHTMKYPFGRGVKSPLHFPLFPLSGQRRWSEAAAGEVMTDTGDGAMRRWSMPWDCARIESNPWQQRYLPSKLVVPPPNSSQERSRSTTPESFAPLGTIASGEGLAEAIQLLSCRPTRSSIPCQMSSGHTWGETHEERMYRRMHPGPASQRGNWQSIDVAHPGMSVTEHYDIFPPGMPLTSRKSSSSTDSSSCLSIHSKSTSSSDKGSDAATGGADAMRIHGNLYSMWSGNEHLSFVRLPESQEPQDDSDTDDPSTERSGKLEFPKPM